MKKAIKNVKIIAIKPDDRNDIFIYLDFSGQREFVMAHRHNGILYKILKNGISVEDFNRMNLSRLNSKIKGPNRKRRSESVKSVINHLKKVVESYLDERRVIYT